jgi:hypothetical protein
MEIIRSFKLLPNRPQGGDQSRLIFPFPFTKADEIGKGYDVLIRAAGTVVTRTVTQRESNNQEIVTEKNSWRAVKLMCFE